MERQITEVNILETQLNKLLNKAVLDKNDHPEIRVILGKLVVLDDYAENKNFQFLNAILRNDLPVAQEFLSEGVELTGPIIAEHTLLMLAVLLNNPYIVESIYQFKKNKGEQLFDADQALLDAVTYDLSDCVAVLLKCGVDTNDEFLRRRNGDNPLIIAIKQENISMYEKLIAGGADIDTEHPGMPSARQYMEKYLAPNEHKPYIQIFEGRKIAKAEAELASGKKCEQLVQDSTAIGVDSAVAAGKISVSQPMDLSPISHQGGDDL